MWSVGSLMTGSEHNDEFYIDAFGNVRTRTNRSGGIQVTVTHKLASYSSYRFLIDQAHASLQCIQFSLCMENIDPFLSPLLIASLLMLELISFFFPCD